MKLNKLIRLAFFLGLLGAQPVLAMSEDDLLDRENSHESCNNDTPKSSPKVSPDRPHAVAQAPGNRARRGALVLAELGEANGEEQEMPAADGPVINQGLINAAQGVIVNLLRALPNDNRHQDPAWHFAVRFLFEAQNLNLGNFQVEVPGSPASQNIRRINEAARILLEHWQFVGEELMQVTQHNSPYRTREVVQAVLANGSMKPHIYLIELLRLCWTAN